MRPHRRAAVDRDDELEGDDVRPRLGARAAALDGTMRDAMRSSFAATTYDRWQWALLQLRIDHVFVSDQLCDMDGSTFTVPGSDHDALEVDLGACPS